MKRILPIFALCSLVFGLLSTGAARAAFQCGGKEYSSCNPPYYLVVNQCVNCVAPFQLVGGECLCNPPYYLSGASCVECKSPGKVVNGKCVICVGDVDDGGNCIIKPETGFKDLAGTFKFPTIIKMEQ